MRSIGVSGGDSSHFHLDPCFTMAATTVDNSRHLALATRFADGQSPSSPMGAAGTRCTNESSELQRATICWSSCYELAENGLWPKPACQPIRSPGVLPSPFRHTLLIDGDGGLEPA